MAGHATGTHEAALRLALSRDDLPDPRTDRSAIDAGTMAGWRILDLGAGPNPFPWVAGGAEYIHRREIKVTVDLPGTERPEGEALWSDAHVETDLNDLDGQWSLLHQQYDLVVAIELIEHLENPWALMRRIRTCLAADGRAIVSTPDICSKKARRWFLDTGFPSWFSPADLESTGHISPILPHLFREMARRAGLVVTGQAWNEPPPHWVEQASDAEIADIKEAVQVWRLEVAP